MRGYSNATVEARKQTPTGLAQNVMIGPGDPISNVPVIIDFPHHQIHEGEAWEYCSIITSLNGIYDFRISVPTLTATTRTPHLIVEVISDSTTTTLGLYEGVTWTASGTDDSAKIFNKNRNVTSPASPNTKIYITGGTALTVNSTGTQIHCGYLFATAKGSTSNDRSLSEWVLKSNTEYMYRVNTSASGNVLVRIHFYEDAGI